MSIIKTQILENFKDLTITKSSTTPIIKLNAINQLLTSKETYMVSTDDRDMMFSCENDILLDEHRKFYDSIYNDRSINIPENIYNSAELFISYGKFIPSYDYLQYMKFATSEFPINVYGGVANNVPRYKKGDIVTFNHIAMRMTNLMQERRDFQLMKNDDHGLLIPESVVHCTVETTYKHELLLPCSQNVIPSLLTNIPYSLYSTQLFKGNIFTYDLSSKEYMVCGKSIPEINELIKKVSIEGISDPIVMRINESCLTPIDNDDAIMLFISIYLGLDTIPAILYMTNDKILTNEILESLYDLEYSGLWENLLHVNMVNDLLYPYFNFTLNKKSEESYTTCIDYSNYMIMNNVTESTKVIDRYLKIDPDNIPSTISESYDDDISDTVNTIQDDLLDNFYTESQERHKRVLDEINNMKF